MEVAQQHKPEAEQWNKHDKQQEQQKQQQKLQQQTQQQK